MKIYKFKDLTDLDKHHHFLQIVLENKIWCASPDSLNDEDEFNFELDYSFSSNTVSLLTQVLAKYKTNGFHRMAPALLSEMTNEELETLAKPIVINIVSQCRETLGVTSFSINRDDEQLWDEYGGKGNGVCVEIDIPDTLVGQYYHLIQYVSEKKFHLDLFLKSALFSDKISVVYKNILTTKTKKWATENEIRFIGKKQNVNLIFDGEITKIIFGSNVPAKTMNKLEGKIKNNKTAKNIPISRAKK